MLGTAIAAPIGVATAVWLTEYGRPFSLARAVESGVEIIAGTPSIVLAIFGLIIFQQKILGFLSFTAEGGSVFGRSFLTAVADDVADRAAADRRLHARGAERDPRPRARGVLRARQDEGGDDPPRPAAVGAPSIGTGTTLGMGRIAGDTAIVVVLLGASLQLQGFGGVPGLSTLRGTGSTLTSYVYANSPAGEGNAPEKAYAAAFVLLMIVDRAELRRRPDRQPQPERPSVAR